MNENAELSPEVSVADVAVLSVWDSGSNLFMIREVHASQNCVLVERIGMVSDIYYWHVAALNTMTCVS